MCEWNYSGSKQDGCKVNFIKPVLNFNLIAFCVMWGKGRRSVYMKSKGKYKNKRKQNGPKIIMCIKLMCFLLRKMLSKIAQSLYKGK